MALSQLPLSATLDLVRPVDSVVHLIGVKMNDLPINTRQYQRRQANTMSLLFPLEQHSYI
jgi:hypothetical protein